MNLHDIVDINLLQKVQDSFAEATGLAAVTVDFRGNPITNYSNFSPFCRLVRNHKNMQDSCLKCDAFGGLEAARKEVSYIYRCHTGLVDFAVPIIVKGQFMGSMLVGQVKLDESENNKLDFVTNEFSAWEEDEEMVKEYENVPVISYQKIEAAAQMMFYVINNMFEKDFMNYVQEELNMKSKEVTNTQAKLEKALFHQHVQSLKLQEAPKVLFNAINLLSNLAIIEQAPKTQKLIIALSELMNYVLRNNQELVPLKDELSYIENYIMLQNQRFNDRINVIMQFLEKDKNIYLPPMILQPILEYIITNHIETSLEKETVFISGFVHNHKFLLGISNNIAMNKRVFIPLEKNDGAEKIRTTEFHSIYSILDSYYGDDYQFSKSFNMVGGYKFQLEIPMNVNGGTDFANTSNS